jgi:GNAT superfamily N-acetyltransferase
MVLHEAGEWLAGSAVNYRRVRDAGENEMTVGIMTGSWTLPASRGRGLFTRIIQESRKFVAERGGSHLLAFVTHDNASRRRLEAAGSWMVPTHYVFANEETPKHESSVEWRPATEAEVAELHERVESARRGRARFSYPEADEFHGQHLMRANPTEVLATDAGDFAVVENAGSNDRTQLFVPSEGASLEGLLGGLLVRAQARGRGLFYFSTRGGEEEVAAALGLCHKPGFLTVIPACGEASGKIPEPLRAWWIDSGDRM